MVSKNQCTDTQSLLLLSLLISVLSSFCILAQIEVETRVERLRRAIGLLLQRFENHCEYIVILFKINHTIVL